MDASPVSAAAFMVVIGGALTIAGVAFGFVASANVSRHQQHSAPQQCRQEPGCRTRQRIDATPEPSQPGNAGDRQS